MHWIFWLIAIAISFAAGYWLFITDKKRAIPYPWLTASLRGLVIFFTLLLILVPSFTITRSETKKPVILLLQDDSRSIANALNNDSAAYRQHMQQLLSRLHNKYQVVQWGFGDTLQTDSVFRYRQQATDIAAAISRAQDFFGQQNLGAIILATDGRYNKGINPLYQQLDLHSPVYTVALGDSAAQKDIRITNVYANKTVTLGSQFEVRADIVAALCNGYSGNVQLLENGQQIASAPLSIPVDRYDHSVSFILNADKAGLHHYVINAPAADGEKNTANNRKDVFVEVEDEKKNIIIVSAAPDPDVNAIKEALTGITHYRITTCTADNMPASFSDFQVVILHGLPSRMINAAQLKNMRKPVWYILTAGSDINALNVMQRAGVIAPAMPHDVLPAYNPSFSLFLLPQNIQTVTDDMPPLSVPAGSIQLSPDASTLFNQKIGNVVSQQPLWLLQQGSVPAALLAGEGIWRWRIYEFKNFGTHNVIDECIRQTVAFLAANSNAHPFHTALPKYIWSDQEPVNIEAWLVNANNEQINTPDATLTIADSAGRKQSFSFERSGTSYKLNLGVWAGGTYNYIARTAFDGKTYIATGSFVVESIPLELMEQGADYPLLYGLAKKYNGAFVPAANVATLYDSIAHNENIKPIIQTTAETVPLVNWKWYFFLILLFAVAEWLLRKYWLAQ